VDQMWDSFYRQHEGTEVKWCVDASPADISAAMTCTGLLVSCTFVPGRIENKEPTPVAYLSSPSVQHELSLGS